MTSLLNRSYSKPGFALCLCCFILAGCTDSSPDAPFIDYVERVARTVDLTAPVSKPAPLPLPPRVGAVQIVLQKDSLDTLDFLALAGCDVQVTIGKKNSSLGRFAKPSQALLLELEFLRLAPSCIASLKMQDKSALAQQLHDAWLLKQTQIPARVFNATLGSEEYRAFWRSAKPEGAFPAVPNATTLHALHALNRSVEQWLGGDYAVEGFEFELLLSEVAGGDGGGVLKAMQRQLHWLQTADALLAQRARQGALCSPNRRDAAADILPNVVSKYFVDGLQANAAALNRRFLELLPPIQRLEASLKEVLPEEYDKWRTARDLLLQRASQAPRKHVGALQALLAPCGDMQEP